VDVATGQQRKEERAYARLGETDTFSSSSFSSLHETPGALTSELDRTTTQLQPSLKRRLRRPATTVHAAGSALLRGNHCAAR
jgi:hypothetical protein